MKKERADKGIPQNHPAFLSKEEQEMSRRAFMKWMGAGAALMGLTLPACRRVEKYLVPYNEGPEWSVPGVETAYATCININGITYPVLAACYEGRPVKLIPSLQYPDESGLNAAVQASILNLYDPERSHHVLFNGQRVSEDEFKGAFSSWARHLKDGAPIGILLPPTDSPLIRSMLEEIRRKNRNVRLYAWSALPRPGSAMQQSSGEGTGLRVRFTRAKRILAIDCDFLHENPFGCTRDFIKARSPEGINYRDEPKRRTRLYAVEGRLSLTGAHADHRLAAAPSRIGALVTQLYTLIAPEQKTAPIEKSALLRDAIKPEELQWLTACAKDLMAHPTESLVLIGDQYPELAPMVRAVNEHLKAYGSCIQLQQEEMPLPHAGLEEFMADLEQKKISVAFMLNAGNPIAQSPAADRLKKALSQAESIHLGMYPDETAAACRWHLPAAHALESWGIERDRRGRFCYRQPVILPLYGGISAEEVLSGLISTRGQLITADNAPNHLSPVYHRARKCYERAVNPEDKTAAWNRALRQGYSDETAYAPVTTPPAGIGGKMLNHGNLHAKPAQGRIELQFTHDNTAPDATFRRNAWMQECPDPITGVSWAASAQISPQSFRRLGGSDHTPAYATFTTKRGSVRLILCPIPGVADELIILSAIRGGINIFTATSKTSLIED